MSDYSHDTSTRKLRIFLCHASEDKPVVRDIYQKLKRYNVELWLDEKDLLPGQNWEQLIPEVIRKCDIILICLSRTFLVKEGYIHYEMRLILEAAKRKPVNTIYHIPLRLDDCEMPSYLASIHFASHFVPEDFEKLIAACEERRKWLNTMHGMNIEPLRKNASQYALDAQALSGNFADKSPSQLDRSNNNPGVASSPGNAASRHHAIDRSVKVERFDMTTSLNPVNVFLSYVHEDKLLLDQLEAHLSSLKWEGLISTWCDRQIMPGANWAGVIDQRLEQASLILLLVSADFLASDYCYQVEVKRALELHQAGKAIVIPIVMRPTDWKGTPFGQLQALPTGVRAITEWSNQDDAFVDVVAGIRRVVEALATRPPGAMPVVWPVTATGPLVSRPIDERKTEPLVQQEADEPSQHTRIDPLPQPDHSHAEASEQRRLDRFGAPFPKVWNVPRRHNAFFTGRAAVLQQLATDFQVEHGVEAVPLQAITGLAGMGKTQTAAEYAYRFRENYRRVLWVHAQTRESLILGFQTIAGLLKLPQEHLEDPAVLLQAVKEWFKDERDWLLIFDNADDFEMVAPYIPVGPGHVLLTTRESSTIELAQPRELQALQVEDGALCLLRRAGLLRWNQFLGDISVKLADAARKLADQMNGLPLSLEQAGAYINDTKCGILKYLEHYERYRERLQKIKSGVIPDYALPVAPALMMSSVMIGRSSAAFALLQLCAFLAPEGIPDAFVELTAPELGEMLSPIVDNPILLDQTIRPLMRYSLLEREEQHETTLTTLSIHRILQLVLLDEMDEPTRRLWAQRAVRALLLARQTMPLAVLQPHRRQCLDHIARWKLDIPDADML